MTPPSLIRRMRPGLAAQAGVLHPRTPAGYLRTDEGREGFGC
jgi:hypothetical protein